jgi:tetratricopeptide (TPR) repeat protein
MPFARHVSGVTLRADEESPYLCVDPGGPSETLRKVDARWAAICARIIANGHERHVAFDDVQNILRGEHDRRRAYEAINSLNDVLRDLLKDRIEDPDKQENKLIVSVRGVGYILGEKWSRVTLKPIENPDAYKPVLDAIRLADTAMPEEALQALPPLKSAVKIKPDYALAHGYTAFCHEILFVRAGMRPRDREDAIRHANAALAHGKGDATALTLGAFVKAIVEPAHEAAIEALERAAALDPFSAHTYSRGSMVFGWAGKAERAIDWGERALHVSARNHPWQYCAWHGEFAGYFQSGRYEEAAKAARGAIESNRALSSSYVLLAAALAKQAGRLDDAKKAAADALALQPSFSIREFCAAIGAAPVIANPLAEALEMAGLPRDPGRPLPSQLVNGETIKIISGGQTGVDRAAIDTAIKLGLPYGGWVPKGGWAEDSPVPPGLLRKYPNMCESRTPEDRTRLNVHASDATLILITKDSARRSIGSHLTEEFAEQLPRPYKVFRVDQPDSSPLIADWLKGLGEFRILNIAGPRQSEAQPDDIYALSREVIATVLARVTGRMDAIDS